MTHPGHPASKWCSWNRNSLSPENQVVTGVQQDVKSSKRAEMSERHDEDWIFGNRKFQQTHDVYFRRAVRATGIAKQSSGSSSRKLNDEKREKGGTNIYLFKCVSPATKYAPQKPRLYLFLCLQPRRGLAHTVHH